jgi:hypothetical protein
MENDVQTEFLDAGIGCCWFAYRDDAESSGETEKDAIVRLAQENGLKLWRDGNETHGRAERQAAEDRRQGTGGRRQPTAG